MTSVLIGSSFVRLGNGGQGPFEPDEEAEKLRRRFAAAAGPHIRALRLRRILREARSCALVAALGFGAAYGVMTYLGSAAAPWASTPTVRYLAASPWSGGAAVRDLAADSGLWTASARARHLAAYPNCDAARAVGLAPALRGEPGYWPQHDADHDGIACEPWWRGRRSRY